MARLAIKRLTGGRAPGFTLLEMMIALMILTVSILALTALTVSSIQKNYQNDARNTAIRVTSEKVEKILAMPFANVSSQKLTESVHVRNGTIQYTYSSSMLPLTNDLRQVNITVRYTFRGQQNVNNAVIYKHRAM